MKSSLIIDTDGNKRPYLFASQERWPGQYYIRFIIIDKLLYRRFISRPGRNSLLSAELSCMWTLRPLSSDPYYTFPSQFKVEQDEISSWVGRS